MAGQIGVNSYPPSATVMRLLADGNLVVAVQPTIVTGDAFAAMRLVASDMSGLDSTPDAFSFAPVTNVVPGMVQTSAAITISVGGGEFSIGCSNTWVAAGQVQAIFNSNTVCVRHTSAANSVATVTTTLTVGGVSGTFSSTTGDTVPNAFAFTDRSGAQTTKIIVSAAVTINGITIPVPISVSGGEYSIGCSTTFSIAAATINNGDTVCVRHRAAATYNASVVTTLTVGSSSATFTSTTVPNAPGPPVAPPSGGGGGGSLDLLLLALLAGILLARRTRRRSPLTLRHN